MVSHNSSGFNHQLNSQLPCHIQNMAATAPYFAAAAAAANSAARHQHQMSLFPSYQDPSLATAISSQTAAAAAAMLSLQQPSLPFHSIIPVTLPMITDHTRHLIMSNHHHNAHNNPWANSSQLLLQQLSSAAVAAAARSGQGGAADNNANGNANAVSLEGVPTGIFF